MLSTDATPAMELPMRLKSKSAVGATVQGAKRHRIHVDTIRTISKGDIRRLARRGGVKRLESDIYDRTRQCLRERLTLILRDCVTIVEHRRGNVVYVDDVIAALKRISRPIYGFDPEPRTSALRFWTK